MVYGGDSSVYRNFFMYYMESTLENIKDIELIMLSALRYAMGRSTYIVPIVQSFILNHWDDKAVIPHRYLFIRDVQDFIDKWYNLSESYLERETMESWRKFLTKLKEENEDS